jgi:methionyl-tRNA formyltransferase
MLIVLLPGGMLGERIRDVVARQRRQDDEIVVAYDRPALHEALAHGPEWIVSAGCRFILTPEELAKAGDACNVHPSYLPWGRGANPNVWAIIAREPAGVSIHRMTAGLDRGPLFAQRKIPVAFGDTGHSLYHHLVDEAAWLFAETWPWLRYGGATTWEQRGEGSYHRVADMETARHIEFDDRVTWRTALDTLRAFTFVGHRNIVVEDKGKQWHVEVQITPVD